MESVFLKDLTIVLSTAAFTTFVCRWLKQPAVIGYLIAGLLIGPHTPPFSFVTDLHSIHTMAELGLVVLMFVLGLEFSLPKLRRVGGRASIAVVLQLLGMMLIGYVLGNALGWNRHDSIYLAAILSISSTTIIVKVLNDLKLSKEEFAQVVFAQLILEDIAAVVILTVLSGLGARQDAEGMTILRALGDVSFFVILFSMGGLLIVPRLARWMSRFKSSEMLGLFAFSLCLVSAELAHHFGFSMALGAFLIGSIIGVCPEVELIEEWMHPIRDLFSALFFVSAGLLIDPKLLWEFKGTVFIIAVVTILGKTLMVGGASFLVGYSLPISARTGMTMAQIGEFSFVFASLGMKTGLASEFLYPLSVAVSVCTTFSTPYLIRSSDQLIQSFLGFLPTKMRNRLKAYETVHQKQSSEHKKIASRYGIRLIAYFVLVVAGFLVTKGIGYFTGWVWVLSWVLHLPFIFAAINYINHFLLLTLTELSVRSRAAKFFQKIPIQGAYQTAEWGIWLACAWLWVISSPFSQQTIVIRLAAFLAAILLRVGLQKPIRWLYDRLERILDDMIGLASSEPLRQAAVNVGESLINDSIQRISITRKSAAAFQTLRELRLRELSGASVIGVYRHGQLNSNPIPDTQVKPNDVLVLLGNPEECQKARQLLSEKSS